MPNEPHRRPRPAFVAAAALLAFCAVAFGIDLGQGFYHDPSEEDIERYFGPGAGQTWLNGAKPPATGAWQVFQGRSNSVEGSGYAYIGVDAQQDFVVRMPVYPGPVGSGIHAGYQFLLNASTPNLGDTEFDFFAEATVNGFSLSFGRFDGDPPATASIVTTESCVILELTRTGTTLHARATVDGTNFTDLGTLQIPPSKRLDGVFIPAALAYAVHGTTKANAAVLGPVRIEGQAPPAAKTVHDGCETARTSLAKAVALSAAGKTAAATAALDTADAALEGAQTTKLPKKLQKGISDRIRTARAKIAEAKKALGQGMNGPAASASAAAESAAVDARNAANNLPPGL